MEAILKKELTVGVIVASIGLTLGYFAKEYQDRPVPSITIERVAFSEIEREKVPPVQIDPELQKLSRKSQWLDTLESQVEFSDLRNIVENDLKETVIELEKLLLFLPKLRDFTERNSNNELTKEEYMRFYSDTQIEPMTLTYATMNIAGAIRRGEIHPTQLLEKIPELAVSPSILGRRGEWKLKEIAEEKENDREEILALALVMEWFPRDMPEVVRVLQAQVLDQLPINREILKQLTVLYRGQSVLRVEEFVKVSALIVNSGDKTVSVDQYATLDIPEINRKFFMVSDQLKGRLAIQPGGFREISFRSEQPLGEESTELKTLYGTEIFKCQLTMRILTQQDFTPVWLRSNLTEFGSKDKIKEMFLKNESG